MPTSSKSPPPPTTARTGLSNVLSKITRDLVLFVAGLGLTINEAVFRHAAERPTLLLLYAGMMGLPFALRADEIRRKNGNGDA